MAVLVLQLELGLFQILSLSHYRALILILKLFLSFMFLLNIKRFLFSQVMSWKTALKAGQFLSPKVLMFD